MTADYFLVVGYIGLDSIGAHVGVLRKRVQFGFAGLSRHGSDTNYANPFVLGSCSFYSISADVGIFDFVATDWLVIYQQ